MARSLASLVTDVVAITGRASLSGLTTLAVQAATLKAHQFDDWIKDLTEYSIQFTTSDYYQSLDYKSVIPLWRKPRYIRKYDYSVPPGMPGKFLEYVVPEKVVDEYLTSRLDIFYVAGSNVQIRSSTSLQYLLLGVYLNPDVTELGFSSWIADDHPFAIIYDAAATIFKTTGRDEENVAYRAMVTEQLAAITRDAVTGVGS